MTYIYINYIINLCHPFFTYNGSVAMSDPAPQTPPKRRAPPRPETPPRRDPQDEGTRPPEASRPELRRIDRANAVGHVDLLEHYVQREWPEAVWLRLYRDVLRHPSLSPAYVCVAYSSSIVRVGRLWYRPSPRPPTPDVSRVLRPAEYPDHQW